MMLLLSLCHEMERKVEKPFGGKNSYESFTLENRLVVIAIADPDATVSYLSLVVRAGSSRDPQNAPGLTNFWSIWSRFQENL